MPTPPDNSDSTPSRESPAGPDRLAELAAAAARGDQRAFSELHERFAPGLRRMFLARSAGGSRAMARGREELADDLSQRAWTLVWRAVAAGKYQPERAAFSTFLYAVASNVWLQHLRESGRRAPASAGGFELDITGEAQDHAESLALAQHLDVIRAVLRGESLTPPKAGEAAPGGPAAPEEPLILLTEQERDILRGSGAGESDRDLAKRLGLAPSTVNEKKQAALRKLRRVLARHGLFGPGDADS